MLLEKDNESTIYELSNPCNIPGVSGADAASVTRQVLYIHSTNEIEFKKGYIYEIQISTRITQGSTAIDYPIPVVWTVSSGPQPVNLVLRDIKINYENRGSTNSVTTFNGVPLTVDTYPQQIVYYSLYFQATYNGTAKFYIGRPNSSQVFNLPPTSSDSLYVPPMQISPFSNIYEYSTDSPSDEAAEKELEDRDNLESQSSTTDNQADNAGNAAETTGTTLFGAFTQLLTALTNVNGNSCTLPNMQVYSLNLGRMNLCTYTIPSQITALVSIGMVFIIVPLGVHLVKKMINLYKEITG